MLSIVQLSRFFLCSFSSDSFYILSKALSFVKNFFNFFHFLFCEAFSQRVSSYIISFVSVFVKNFFDFFKNFSDIILIRYFPASRTTVCNSHRIFDKIFRASSGEGGIWTLAPLLTTYSLSRGAPSTSWVLLLGWILFHIQFIFAGKSLKLVCSGEGGIRTHAPLRTNGFQDRLVMTTSIPLRTRFSILQKFRRFVKYFFYFFKTLFF